MSPAYSDHAEALGVHKWTILGDISRADPFALGLDKIMSVPEPAGCWTRELDYWEGVIDAVAIGVPLITTLAVGDAIT